MLLEGWVPHKVEFARISNLKRSQSSMKNILFVGIDVDSKNYHVCILNQATGETFAFRQIADVPLLIKKLRAYKKKGNEIRVCYEASFVGFSLCRALKADGI